MCIRDSIYATVLEGEIKSQVNDGPVKVYRAGESFSENPGDRHGVSANASTTKPARLLAVFVVDSGEKDLTTPLKSPETQMTVSNMSATIKSGATTRTLAGITVPDTLLVDEALAYARRACEPYLFNHVVRSWLFAVRIGQIRNVAHDEEVVAVGTLLHDVTLNERFDGPRRFEVEG